MEKINEQSEKMYTEEEVITLLEKRDEDLDYWYEWKRDDYPYLNEWFKQFKK